ncbi:MAG: lipoprotein signal peptidase [Bacteroidetes bacterium]|nr:lipoprotein signal peptidase [Bacteroidota bacterium]
MKYRNAILIVLAILIADQVLKIYIKTHFVLGEYVDVSGDWFKLLFVENKGMAFGMKISDSSWGKLILTLFRLGAVVAGFFILKSLVRKHYSRGLILCGTLILAGAAGNLIDSIFYGMIFSESIFHVAHFTPWGQGYASLFHGQVVDMFYFPIMQGTWPSWMPVWGGDEFRFFEPVFNLADASITTGVLVLLVFQKKLLHKKSLPADRVKQEPEAVSSHS